LDSDRPVARSLLERFEVISVDGRAPGVEAVRILAACRTLRRAVFVEEQQVPETLEWDGLDGEARHFLVVGPARESGQRPAFGTARMRIVHGAAKAERVAVDRDARRLGVGRLLMDALEGHARQQALASVVLHAQVAAIPFYERLGYRADGPVFLDAGIDHRAMEKVLDA